jgi:uncharacterized lipoprotein
VKNVRLARGYAFWLVVDDKAENVWPMVKAFWLENGLTIRTKTRKPDYQAEWVQSRQNLWMHH